MKQLFPSFVLAIFVAGCGLQEPAADKESVKSPATQMADTLAGNLFTSDSTIENIPASRNSKKQNARQLNKPVVSVKKAIATKRIANIEEPTIDDATSQETSFIAQLRNDYLTQFPPEEFDIDGNETTSITTAAGTIITIDSRNLETLDGKAFEGPIKFYIKEMVTPADMLRMHAPTMSNGEMLESGGAWYINATANGKTLKIKQGRSITIAIKRQDQTAQNDFTVFTANATQNTNGNIDWQQTGQPFSNTRLNSTGYSNSGTQLYDEYFRVGKRKIYPAEIWQIHKTYLSKESKAKRLFNKTNGIYKYEDFYLSELTAKQTEQLGQIVGNGEIVNRHTSLFGAETRVSFLFEYGTGAQGTRLMIDSVALTDLSPWLPKRLKNIVSKKITVFNRSYFTDANKANEASAIYEMSASLQQFGWINCDRFSGYSDKTFYYTNIKGADTVKNIHVYMVFKTLKSLLTANLKRAQKNLYQFEKIPPGQEVMLVATGFNGTNYFAGKSSYFLLQPKGNTDLPVAQMSKEEMQSFLQKLE